MASAATLGHTATLSPDSGDPEIEGTALSQEVVNILLFPTGVGLGGESSVYNSTNFLRKSSSFSLWVTLGAVWQ